MTRWHFKTAWHLVLIVACVATWAACVPTEEGEPAGSLDGSSSGNSSDGSSGGSSDASADATGSDASANDDDAGPDDDARDEPVWPPEVETTTDSVETDSKGGTYELLEGEVVLTVPPETFEDDTKLTLERGIIDLGDDSLVGYIWGPHGDVVDPPATVTATVPAVWIPPFDGGVDGIGLYAVTDSGDLEALNAADVRFEGDEVVLSGELRVLGRLVIAGPGL